MPCLRDGIRLAAAIKVASGQCRALVQAGWGGRCDCPAGSAMTALRRVLNLTVRWGALSRLASGDGRLRWPRRCTSGPCALEPGHPVPPGECPGREAGVITSGVTPWLARSRVAQPHHAHAGCSGIMRGQALVAQPDRVVASEAIGRGFESLRAHQFQFQGLCWDLKEPSRDRGFFVVRTQRKVNPEPLASRLIGHRWAHPPSTQECRRWMSHALKRLHGTLQRQRPTRRPGYARVRQSARSWQTDRLALGWRPAANRDSMDAAGKHPPSSAINTPACLSVVNIGKGMLALRSQRRRRRHIACRPDP